MFSPENEASQGTGDHPHLGKLSFFRDSKFNFEGFFIGESS